MDYDDLKVILWAIGIIVLVVIGVTYFAKAIDMSQCYKFGEVSGRETKFVQYTAVSWDCLTPQKDGKWISTTLLREIN